MSRKSSFDNISSVAGSGSRLCEVVDARTRGGGAAPLDIISASLHRAKFLRLQIRRIHRLRHSPVLEFGVAADVAQVGNLPSPIDVRMIGGERLLRLLGIRLLGEEIVFERVLDGVLRKALRSTRQ